MAKKTGRSAPLRNLPNRRVKIFQTQKILQAGIQSKYRSTSRPTSEKNLGSESWMRTFPHHQTWHLLSGVVGSRVVGVVAVIRGDD